MDFNDYQKKSRATVQYPAIGHNITYPVIGLADECGEVSEKVKKCFRDNEGNFDEETTRKIKLELGDVLWYVAQIATELSLTLDEVAVTNLYKLSLRKQIGTIKGEGDDR